MEKPTQVVQPWQCPNCGGVVEEVDGWVEYGDQTVEITVMGCFTCGWRLESDLEPYEEEYEREG